MKCHRIRLKSDGSEHYAEKHYWMISQEVRTEYPFEASDVLIKHQIDATIKRCFAANAGGMCLKWDPQRPAGTGCDLKGNFETCASLALHSPEHQQTILDRRRQQPAIGIKKVGVRAPWKGDMFFFHEEKQCWQIIAKHQYEMITETVPIRNVN